MATLKTYLGDQTVSYVKADSLGYWAIVYYHPTDKSLTRSYAIGKEDYDRLHSELQAEIDADNQKWATIQRFAKS